MPGAWRSCCRRDTEHLQIATDALGFYADEVNGRKPCGSKPRRSTTNNNYDLEWETLPKLWGESGKAIQ